jgi:SAP domain
MRLLPEQDNPALVLSELQLKETPAQWRERQGALWRTRFAKLTVPELKAELTRRGAGRLGGRKEALLARLVNHIIKRLGSGGDSNGAAAHKVGNFAVQLCCTPYYHMMVNCVSDLQLMVVRSCQDLRLRATTAYYMLLSAATA